MQHLDDALIAEWVDGAVDEDSPRYQAIAAHVADCDTCRTRVDEERALAEHVRGLLGAAAPPERVPPFEEVLHRAGRARRAGTLPPAWRRLAWAATVALAGGIGWYARGAMLERQARPTEAQSPPPPAATPPLAATESAPVAEPEAPAQGLLDAAARRDEGAAAKSAPSPAEPARVQAQEEMAADAVAEERRQAVPTDAGRRDTPDARNEMAARLARTAPAPLGAAALAESAAPGWVPLEPADAEALLGHPPLSVPDLPVALIARSPSGDSVRVVQELGNGRLLMLVQTRALPANARGAEGTASGAAASDAALAVATVVTAGVRVTGSAPVSPDSLRGLLAKLR